MDPPGRSTAAFMRADDRKIRDQSILRQFPERSV